MKKSIIISLSGAVVLIALGVFIFSQTSAGTDMQASNPSSCGQTEAVITTANTASSGCCSSGGATMTAAKGSDCGMAVSTAASVECPAIIQAANSAGCTGVQPQAASSNCSGAVKATENTPCGSSSKGTEAESVEKVQALNTSEPSCCEGSATAALLADACCGNCG